MSWKKTGGNDSQASESRCNRREAQLSSFRSQPSNSNAALDTAPWGNSERESIARLTMPVGHASGESTQPPPRLLAPMPTAAKSQIAPTQKPRQSVKPPSRSSHRGDEVGDSGSKRISQPQPSHEKSGKGKSGGWLTKLSKLPSKAASMCSLKPKGSSAESTGGKASGACAITGQHNGVGASPNFVRNGAELFTGNSNRADAGVSRIGSYRLLGQEEAQRDGHTALIPTPLQRRHGKDSSGHGSCGRDSTKLSPDILRKSLAELSQSDMNSLVLILLQPPIGVLECVHSGFLSRAHFQLLGEVMRCVGAAHLSVCQTSNPFGQPPKSRKAEKHTGPSVVASVQAIIGVIEQDEVAHHYVTCLREMVQIALEAEAERTNEKARVTQSTDACEAEAGAADTQGANRSAVGRLQDKWLSSQGSGWSPVDRGVTGFPVANNVGHYPEKDGGPPLGASLRYPQPIHDTVFPPDSNEASKGVASAQMIDEILHFIGSRAASSVLGDDDANSNASEAVGSPRCASAEAFVQRCSQGLSACSGSGSPPNSAGPVNGKPCDKVVLPPKFLISRDFARVFLKERGPIIQQRMVQLAESLPPPLFTALGRYCSISEPILAPYVEAKEASGDSRHDFFVSIEERHAMFQRGARDGAPFHSAGDLVAHWAAVSSSISDLLSPFTLFASLLLAERIRQCKNRFPSSGGFYVEGRRPRELAAQAGGVTSRASHPESASDIISAMCELELSLDTLQQYTELICLLYERCTHPTTVKGESTLARVVLQCGALPHKQENEKNGSAKAGHHSQSARGNQCSSLGSLAGLLFKTVYLFAGGAASIAADDRRSAQERELAHNHIFGVPQNSRTDLPSSATFSEDTLISELLHVASLDRLFVLTKLLGFDEAGRLHTTAEVDVCSGVLRLLLQFCGLLPLGHLCPTSIVEWLPLLPLYAISNESKRALLYVFSVSSLASKESQRQQQRQQQRVTFKPVSREDPLGDVSNFVMALHFPTATGVRGQARRVESHPALGGAAADASNSQASAHGVLASYKIQPVFFNSQAGIENGEGQGPTKELFDLCSSLCSAKLLPAVEITSSAVLAMLPGGMKEVNPAVVRDTALFRRECRSSNAAAAFSWISNGERDETERRPSPGDATALQCRGAKVPESGLCGVVARSLRQGDVLEVKLEPRGGADQHTHTAHGALGSGSPAVGGVAEKLVRDILIAQDVRSTVVGAPVGAADCVEREWTVERVLTTTLPDTVILLFASPSDVAVERYKVTAVYHQRACRPPFLHESGEPYAWTNPAHEEAATSVDRGDRGDPRLRGGRQEVLPTPFTIGWLLGNAIPNGLLHFNAPFAPLFFRLLSRAVKDPAALPEWLADAEHSLAHLLEDHRSGSRPVTASAGKKAKKGAAVCKAVPHTDRLGHQRSVHPCDVSLMSAELLSRIAQLAQLPPQDRVALLVSENFRPSRPPRPHDSRGGDPTEHGEYTAADFAEYLVHSVVRNHIFNLPEVEGGDEGDDGGTRGAGNLRLDGKPPHGKNALFWSSLLWGFQATPIGRSTTSAAPASAPHVRRVGNEESALPCSPSVTRNPLFTVCCSRTIREVLCGMGSADDENATFAFTKHFRITYSDDDSLAAGEAVFPHSVVFRRVLLDVMEGNTVDAATAASASAFSVPERRALLKFITGRAILPGKPKAEHIRIDFTPQPMTSRQCEQYQHYLPSSHSCDNTLEIPNYLECLLFAPSSPFYAAPEDTTAPTKPHTPTWNSNGSTSTNKARFISDADRRSAWHTLTTSQQQALTQQCVIIVTAKLRQACTHSATYELDEVS